MITPEAPYREINRCRIGGDGPLITVLDLGRQALTGVFPKTKGEPVTVGPLELVWCPASGLLQLKHSYNPSEMYGDNYGYRSGLNQSMVDHLSTKVERLERIASVHAGDVVLDIGSNDCTTLKAYKTSGLRRLGIDPVGKKFIVHYPADVALIPDFFSEKAYRSKENAPAKVITSIAMFYDLEAPIDFARQIEAILADDGVWHFEQSYMPSMLRSNAYDTVCHEHVEYYSLTVVRGILEKAGLEIADVILNGVNGGSFAVTAVKRGNTSVKRNDAVVNWLLEQESRMGLGTSRPYRQFEERVFQHREDLVRLVRALRADGKTILGYGASTKGNVLLQFCGFSTNDILAIADVNPEKYGRVTPGTHIPIVSEADAYAMKPDYFLVLPWHFKEGILRREKKHSSNGGKFIFPLPEIEIV